MTQTQVPWRHLLDPAGINLTNPIQLRAFGRAFVWVDRELATLAAPTQIRSAVFPTYWDGTSYRAILTYTRKAEADKGFLLTPGDDGQGRWAHGFLPAPLVDGKEHTIRVSWVYENRHGVTQPPRLSRGSEFAEIIRRMQDQRIAGITSSSRLWIHPLDWWPKDALIVHLLQGGKVHFPLTRDTVSIVEQFYQAECRQLGIA